MQAPRRVTRRLVSIPSRTRPCYTRAEPWYDTAAHAVPCLELERGGPLPGISWESLGWVDGATATYWPYPQDWRGRWARELAEGVLRTSLVLGVTLHVIRGYWPDGDRRAPGARWPSVERWHALGRAVDVTVESSLSLDTLVQGIAAASARDIPEDRRLPWRGIGRGRGHIHLDLRSGRRWVGSVVSCRYLPTNAGRPGSGVGLTPGAPRPASVLDRR